MPQDYENLFQISNTDDFRASIRTGMDLRGFSGVWRLQILAKDRGSLGNAGESQMARKSYEISIEPYNFEAPRIIFPRSDETFLVE